MIARVAGWAFTWNARLTQREGVAEDVRAGWESALVMLPQAVILATLAGMPPEAGVYASVFPVIVAALLGASRTLLSGPNTAVAVMTAAALMPLATPASAEYVSLALTLAAMVGLMQLACGAGRLGRLLEAMPDFVVQGVTLGIGLVIIFTQCTAVLGVLSVPGEAPWLYLWHALAALDRLNLYAVLVALVSVVTGVLVRRRRVRFLTPLVAALASGTVCAVLCDLVLGADAINLERLGHMTIQLLPLSFPVFAWEELYVLKQLLQSALAIAVIGALQTVIIARSISKTDGQSDDPSRELVAQGAANVVASLTSGFAGSGSFNRSAAHVAAGARTPLAAVCSALMLFAVVAVAAPLLAYVPVAAMAGTLLLVGWGLFRSVPFAWPQRSERPAFMAMAAVAFMVIAAGLETAVFWGCAAGVAALVWRHSLNANKQ
jgi:sulfate permease, SulP family